MAKKASKTVDNETVTIEFVNDATLSVALTELPKDILTRLACHGLSQKLGDSYAGAESAEDAHIAASRVAEELKAGNWTSARASGTGAIRTTLLAEALARVASKATGSEVTIEDAREVLEEMEDEQKKDLRKDPGIQRVIAEIKVERAKAAEAKAAEESPEGGSMVASLFGT